jgi:hypothetical protein
MNARDGTPHIHGCLNCRPDMVPDFTRDDPRYHDGEKCGRDVQPLINGAATGYTCGMYDGPEGWVLSASERLDVTLVHICPNCYDEESGEVIPNTCLEPLFGRVEVLGCHPWAHLEGQGA